MIINQNVLSVVRSFSNFQQQKKKKTITLRRKPSNLLLLNFSAKFLRKKKISNE